MTAPISKALDIAADLCRRFEGFYSKPYLCPAGYPTIGYGTVYKPGGSKVTLTDEPITRDTAENWLRYELERVCLPGVLKASPILAAEPEILAAMMDFTYNLGVGRYKASTLRRRINQRDWVGAQEQLMLWVNGTVQGVLRPLPGLVLRRRAECDLL